MMVVFSLVVIRIKDDSVVETNFNTALKILQFRGGSELLVEAGDQRRVIRLPSQIQGKVAGAKFADRSLLITMR